MLPAVPSRTQFASHLGTFDPAPYLSDVMKEVFLYPGTFRVDSKSIHAKELCRQAANDLRDNVCMKQQTITL